jgi:hypothetical protein
VNLSAIDIAWLAGYLEGEGSFGPGPPSCPKYPRVTLQTTDEDVIQKLAGYFDKSYQRLTPRNGWKVCYVFTMSGSRAVKLMKLIYPYMGQRRKKQIDKALGAF